MKKIGWISFLLVLIDQIIKYGIRHTMYLQESKVIFPNFFSITYTRNNGAAWSILSGNRIFLILVAFFCLFFLYEYCLKEKYFSSYETIFYSLLIGGIMGNLIDRIFFGYVIDYLDFTIFSYAFPIFNFADMCIVIGVGLLIFEILRGEKHGTTHC